MSIEDFFEGTAQKGRARISKKCSVCRDERLRDEVQTYVDKRLAGETLLTPFQIWNRYFSTAWAMGSHLTLQNHIRFHLGISLDND